MIDKDHLKIIEEFYKLYKEGKIESFLLSYEDEEQESATTISKLSLFFHAYIIKKLQNKFEEVTSKGLKNFKKSVKKNASKK